MPDAGAQVRDPDGRYCRLMGSDGEEVRVRRAVSEGLRRGDVLVGLGLLAWVGLRPFMDIAIRRSTFGTAMLGMAVLAVVSVLGMPRRKLAHVRPWRSTAGLLAMCLLLGGLDAVTPMGDRRIGFALIVGVCVTPVVASLGRILHLRRTSVEDRLDAAMMAFVTAFLVWEHSFEAEIAGAGTMLVALAGLAYVAVGLGVGMLALLGGRDVGYGRSRVLLAAGLLAQAVGLIVAPDPLVGGRFADNAFGSGLTSGGAALLVLALWGGTGRWTIQQGREERSVLWWAPAGASIAAYVFHVTALPSMADRLDPVAAVLLVAGGGCLIGRIASTVSAREALSHVVATDRERLQMLLHDVADHVALVDPDGVVTYSGGGRPSGLAAGEELVGRNLREVLIPSGRDEALRAWARALERPGESVAWVGQVRRRDGAAGWVEVSIVNRIEDPVLGRMVVTFRDITERREAELELERLALFDDLTGLPNRQSLIRHMDQALSWSGPTTEVAVLYLDVDRLKLVNDSLGHHVGDMLICEVARRWQRMLPIAATIGRVGGDEFIVCYPRRPDDPTPVEIAEAMLAQLETPIVVEGHRLTTSASIGIATTSHDATSVDRAIRDADSAMYHAKTQGRDRVAVFTPALRAAAHDRLTFEEDLREAIATEQIVVHLQPILSLAERRTTSLEALVRWHHPERGWVSVDRLVEVAEETGLIVDIGEIVVDRSCAALAELRRQTGRDLLVAVNVAASQLEQPDFVRVVTTALQDHGLPFDALVLEVTEHTLLADAGAGRRALRNLHEAGVQIGLDDFGTGYSSLSYLGTFPLDGLKLDRSMVVRAVAEASGHAVLSGTLSITEQLGLQVVAEGVETAEQLAYVEEQGVSHAQGWFFSPAVPPADVPQAIRRADDIARSVLVQGNLAG